MNGYEPLTQELIERAGQASGESNCRVSRPSA